MRSELVICAEMFAAGAHAAVGQTRKYTNEPYVEHCKRVAAIIEEVGGTDVMQAAALLHDTVEDTGVTLDQIESLFGRDVCLLVYWLTSVSKPEDGNRAARKEIDRQHSANAPSEAQTIKLADIIDNTSNILEHDRSFAKLYLKEKKALAESLMEADSHLRARCLAQIESSIKELRTPTLER